MYRSTFLFLAILISSAACHGQIRPEDSQAVRDLLSEIRQLRKELQATTIATQKTQILIYRLQEQEAAVARSSQRLNEVRDQLARVRDARDRTTGVIKRIEDSVNNTENPATQASRKDFETQLAQAKSRLESLQNDELQKQAQEAEAEQQMRTEENKLNDLRDQLDRLANTLDNVSRSLAQGKQM